MHSYESVRYAVILFTCIRFRVIAFAMHTIFIVCTLGRSLSETFES